MIRRQRLEFVIEVGRGLDEAEAKMQRIATWLDARADVLTWRSSGSFDPWNDDAESLSVTLDGDNE